MSYYNAASDHMQHVVVCSHGQWLVTGDYAVGDVISLLWFKRSLPKYATRFIDMCVMLCADHGPCVSGMPSSTVHCLSAGATEDVYNWSSWYQSERYEGQRVTAHLQSAQIWPCECCGATAQAPTTAS